MLCAISIAFLIGNLLNNKEAINGIVNVVALGSSFFQYTQNPVQWAPCRYWHHPSSVSSSEGYMWDSYTKVLGSDNPKSLPFDSLNPI